MDGKHIGIKSEIRELRFKIEAIDGGDFGKKMADDVFKIGAKVRSKSDVNK